jgi:hypothetical protein
MMCEVLEWDVRVPLVSNVYVLVDILILLILVSGTLGVLILYLTGFENVYDVFRLVLIADGVLIILIFMIMGFVFTNRFQLHYKLDKTGLQVRVGEFHSSFNRLAWRITSFVQRYGVSGGRVFVMVDEVLFVPWIEVSHAVCDTQRRVASLINNKRPIMRVYCTHENVGLIFKTIQRYLPEPEE